MNSLMVQRPQFRTASLWSALGVLLVALLGLAGCGPDQVEMRLPAGAATGLPTLIYVYTDG